MNAAAASPPGAQAHAPAPRPLKIMPRVADLIAQRLADLGGQLSIPEDLLQAATDAANEGRDVWIALRDLPAPELLIGRPRLIDALARSTAIAVIDISALLRIAKAKG